MTFSVFLWRLR